MSPCSVAAGMDVVQSIAAVVGLDMVYEELEAHRQRQAAAYHLSKIGG
eukprot:SAG31_NODE_7640_length_1633_cov_1.318123_3_plen_48_part_00